jgi:adenylate cyclase
LRFEGVIADFQGDASLAFWGWPNPLEVSALSACRAAMSIYRTFYLANLDPDHPLNGFNVGIAAGHGHAIAGRIGSDDQIKVGVFGPVVNLTSRLEGITKQVGASILIDGGMADQIRGHLPPTEGRMRMIGRMRPRGMDEPVDVYQLLPTGVNYDSITDADIAQYEAAVQEVIAGNWDKAQAMLKDLLPDDGPADYLRGLLADHASEPPTGWDGAINLLSK